MSPRRLLATTAVIGVAIGVVAAQESDPTALEPSDGLALKGELAATSQAPPPVSMWAFRFIGSRSADEILAQELIGATVADAFGEEFAEVADLIVDPAGRITGLVLSVGGFLGIGDRRVAIPWGDVRYSGPAQPLMTRAAAAQLEAAPSFQARMANALTLRPLAGRRDAAAAGESVAEDE